MSNKVKTPYSEWQPIETAPKSGVILLCQSHNEIIRTGVWCAMNKLWSTGLDGHMSYVAADYWMPLPIIPIDNQECSSVVESLLQEAIAEDLTMTHLTFDDCKKLAREGYLGTNVGSTPDHWVMVSDPIVEDYQNGHYMEVHKGLGRAQMLSYRKLAPEKLEHNNGLIWRKIYPIGNQTDEQILVEWRANHYRKKETVEEFCQGCYNDYNRCTCSDDIKPADSEKDETTFKEIATKQMGEVLESFDFHEVVKIYKYMDWKISEVVPSEGELRKFALDKMTGLIEFADEQQVSNYYYSTFSKLTVFVVRGVTEEEVPWAEVGLFIGALRTVCHERECHLHQYENKEKETS